MIDLALLEQGLRRVLWTLRPYLPDIVIIGGWVPHLYRRYGGFTEWRSAMSFTQEVDILLDRDVPVGARVPLADLLKASGFHPIDVGEAGAIWESDSVSGEKIEFIVPHTGTAKARGGVTPIRSQAKLAAIALTDTGLMRRHTTVLEVPVSTKSAAIEQLTVRVPLLGAYMATKAATFFKRQAVFDAGEAAANPKSAKDLLYIRDLLAAGDQVGTRIETELRAIATASTDDREDIRSAANHLDVAMRPSPKGIVLEAAAMLAERDGLSQGAARADVIGHLTDCLEILRSVG